MKQVTLFIILLSLAYACTPRMEELVPLATDRNFMPLIVGRQSVFRVDSVFFTFTGDTFSGYHFIRETISDTFTDLSGNLVYRLVREKALQATGPWQYDSVWTAFWQGNRAIRQENNRKVIKILFPIQNGNTWNGNLFNENSGDSVQLYRMENVGKPFTGRFANFSNTITITQFSDTNCVNSILSREVYAQGVGLVFQERKAFDLEAGCTARIVFGKRFITHLVSYE